MENLFGSIVVKLHCCCNQRLQTNSVDKWPFVNSAFRMTGNWRPSEVYFDYYKTEKNQSVSITNIWQVLFKCHYKYHVNSIVEGAVVFCEPCFNVDVFLLSTTKRFFSIFNWNTVWYCQNTAMNVLNNSRNIMSFKMNFLETNQIKFISLHKLLSSLDLVRRPKICWHGQGQRY